MIDSAGKALSTASYSLSRPRKQDHDGGTATLSSQDPTVGNRPESSQSASCFGVPALPSTQALLSNSMLCTIQLAVCHVEQLQSESQPQPGAGRMCGDSGLAAAWRTESPSLRAARSAVALNGRRGVIVGSSHERWEVLLEADGRRAVPKDPTPAMKAWHLGRRR